MNEQFSAQDERFMRRALKLARRGLGRVSPNPVVGAVVVKDGVVAGEGYHLWDKLAHAEVIALERAGRLAEGADIYVTLEPCSHYGRTPPCVDAILSSGIRRVFVAIEDPDLRVSGTGISRLKAGGLQVKVGLCRREAFEINEPFFHSVITGRPLVTLKLAMSMDARIATENGESEWITGSESRKYVHRLRYLHDSILVGSGTFRADNPRLDVRWIKTKRITRVILDSSASCISPGSRILESGDPVLVFHDQAVTPSGPGIPAGNLEYCGVPRGNGILSWQHILEELGRRNIRSVLTEGGGKVAGSLIRQGYVNRLCLFYSSMFIGSEGLPGIGSLDTTELSKSFRFRITRTRHLGNDLCVEGKVDQDDHALPLYVKGSFNHIT